MEAVELPENLHHDLKENERKDVNPDPEDSPETKEEEKVESQNFDESLPTPDNPYRVSITMTIAVAYPKR